MRKIQRDLSVETILSDPLTLFRYCKQCGEIDYHPPAKDFTREGMEGLCLSCGFKANLSLPVLGGYIGEENTY